ncbi:Chloroperoxidase [Pseudomassariella vexata]|uniref:Chloroperoxidase n=1 Tax=Pseudomassariella vexata TaxID=1141098 RepID=A0A1Y2EBE3_9PEZI|nr:Chloroperoxidase [Pseudomassariella vexata]ORY68903.1 Chloroperoxidase [Pseudomassariella vexata]
MNAQSLLLLGAAAFATATADYEWLPAGPGDSRSPCPMLNSLANHGYLPHNGLSISQDDVMTALNESVNFIADALGPIIQLALTTSTTGNASTFNLADTAKHNVIEHDGSLSRDDLHFGNQKDFDAVVWAETVAHFTEETIPLQTAASARVDRLAAAQAVNPEFNLTSLGPTASVFETTLYEITFGDRVEGNPPTEWIRVFFEQERIPFEEGYVRPDNGITTEEFNVMAAKIVALS